MKKRFTDEQIIGFLREAEAGLAAQLSIPRVAPTLERINSAIARWPGFGAEAGVSAQEVARIGALHRRI